MLPLEGITVVALEQAVAAPFATRHLADLGARVIKIERPEVGDFARGYDSTVKGMASYFVWLHRSKASLTLDLKAPVAQDILHQLLVGADVFIHNLAPGAVERLGFGVDELREQTGAGTDFEVSLFESLGECPELSTDERFSTNTRRVANRQALNAMIQNVFSHLTAEQITARLERAQIATAHLNSLQEFWDHPQFQARQRWREVDSPVGRVRALLPPIAMQNVKPRMDAIPAVGEHTVAILRAFQGRQNLPASSWQNDHHHRQPLATIRKGR
jgi:crotonobetainyl-CoA:carnitine CoA-transferase CaiB-like acyl-CoA transferase